MCANLYSHASWTAVCTLCLSHVTYSFIHMCVPTHLGRCPTTHRHDFIYYIYVCLSMLTQLSKTHGNIKHNFIHISVSIVGHRPRRVGTHMCTKLYVCEFIYPRILDGCVGMRTHMYIKSCRCVVGRRPRHVGRHTCIQFLQYNSSNLHSHTSARTVIYIQYA